MSVYTLCEIATGLFTAAQLAGDLELNPPPPGFVWVAGAHSPHTRRASWAVDDFGDVQLQAPIVRVQAPEQPAETAWVSWRWDAAAGRFCEVPKLPLLQANARLPYLDQLAQLDDKLRRPVAEITEAQVLGEPLPEAAVARLRALNADKKLLRDRLAAIASAADAAALAALQATPLPLRTNDN
jgi:hypothetical protein